MNSLLTTVVKRLLAALPNLVGVVVITFILTRALPGDPAAYFAGGAATAEAVEQVRKQLGLDKSLLEQFFLYVGCLSHGDFGTSLTTGQPVRFGAGSANTNSTPIPSGSVKPRTLFPKRCSGPSI